MPGIAKGSEAGSKGLVGGKVRVVLGQIRVTLNPILRSFHVTLEDRICTVSVGGRSEYANTYMGKVPLGAVWRMGQRRERPLGRGVANELDQLGGTGCSILRVWEEAAA